MTFLDDAVAHVKKTTISADEYLRRVDDIESYAYKSTEWYKAIKALEAAAKTPVQPPGSGHPLAANARYILFGDTQVMDAALGAPAKYKVALSADPAFAAEATKENVAGLRAAGHRVCSWCDCESTLPPAAINLASRLALDGWIGQAETFAQYSNATAVWLPPAVAIVGNLTALDQWQVDEIRQFKSPPFVQEDFWNEGWARYPKEPAISSYCAGQYAASWNPSLANLLGAGRFEPGDGLFKIAGVRDWANLP